MSVEVKQIIKPKKYGYGGTTIIRGSGYASTTNNSTINNGNITTLYATTINATEGNIDIVNSSSISSNYVTAVNLTTQTLNVNGVSTLQDLNVNNITQHGDFTMLSYSYANTFNIEQVVAYLGSYNYFDELTGSASSNITSHNINTEYLTVTKSAHFFELIIDKVKSAGGSVLFTPADGFIIDDVVANVAQDYYRLYWRACSEIAEGTEGQTLSQTGQTLTEQVSVNMWQIDDQARCQTFNLSGGAGTYQDISNTYWWRVVCGVSSEPVVHSIDGVLYYCHYIDVYHTTSSYIDAGSDIPSIGDEVAMLGNRTNQQRQGAIYIASSASMDADLKAPLFAEYEGINDFTLSTKKKNWIATGSYNAQPSTQIRGNIVLSSGDTVEDYVDDAVAGIQTGDQFYTNFLSFENQNINIPCMSNGTPLVNSVSTNIWCLHGQNKLNIASISSTFSALSCSYTGNTANVNLTGSSLGFLSDPTTTIPITINAYLSGNSGSTIQYNGNLYITKVKNGAKGEDGISPIVYELSCNASSRTLTYGNSQQSVWSINPSTFRLTINQIDASSATPVTSALTVPTGMTLFYRIYNLDTETWSTSYNNITSTFNVNGYYDWAFSDSYKYSVKFYLYNQEVVGNLTTSNFDDSKIYDLWDIPLMVNGTDGENGTNGTNGVNGKNIYLDMSKAKASVDIAGQLNVNIQGQAFYRDGENIDSSYNFSNYIAYLGNDNPYSSQTGSSYVGNQLVSTISLNNSGSFQYNKTINNWNNYSYIYRPTVLYLNVEDSNSSMAANTVNIPITFEAGATLEITDSISSTVQNQAGQISTLQQTAQGLRTDVNNNSGAISTLQQTATSLTSTVQNQAGQISNLQQSANNINLTVATQSVTNVNQFKKADIPSDWLTDAWVRYPDNDNAVKRDTTETHNNHTSVCLDMAYDTSGNVFMPNAYQKIDKEIPTGTQFLISCYFKYSPASGQTGRGNSVFGLDIQGESNININPTPIGFYIDDIFKNTGTIGSQSRCYGQIESSDNLNTNWHKITFVCKTSEDIPANKLQVRIFGWHSGLNDGTPVTIDYTKQPKFYFSEPITYIDNGADITKNINDSLYETGIDISTGAITLKADKVTFTNSAGTVSDKISINPADGTLNAVNGNFTGHITSNVVYTPYIYPNQNWYIRTSINMAGYSMYTRDYLLHPVIQNGSHYYDIHDFDDLSRYTVLTGSYAIRYQCASSQPTKPADGNNGTSGGWSATKSYPSSGQYLWATFCYMNNAYSNPTYTTWTPAIQVSYYDDLTPKDGTELSFFNNPFMTRSAVQGWQLYNKDNFLFKCDNLVTVGDYNPIGRRNIQPLEGTRMDLLYTSGSWFIINGKFYVYTSSSTDTSRDALWYSYNDGTVKLVHIASGDTISISNP